MNITQEKTGNLNAVVKIKIAPADYTGKVDKAIKDQAKKAQLPGFRKEWCRRLTSKGCMVRVFW